MCLLLCKTEDNVEQTTSNVPHKYMKVTRTELLQIRTYNEIHNSVHESRVVTQTWIKHFGQKTATETDLKHRYWMTYMYNTNMLFISTTDENCFYNRYINMTMGKNIYNLIVGQTWELSPLTCRTINAYRLIWCKFLSFGDKRHWPQKCLVEREGEWHAAKGPSPELEPEAKHLYMGHLLDPLS